MLGTGARKGLPVLVSVPPYHVAAMAAILSSVYSGRRIVQLAIAVGLALAAAVLGALVWF